jgi:hypothetical protein
MPWRRTLCPEEAQVTLNESIASRHCTAAPSNGVTLQALYTSRCQSQFGKQQPMRSCSGVTSELIKAEPNCVDVLTITNLYIPGQSGISGDDNSR